MSGMEIIVKPDIAELFTHTGGSLVYSSKFQRVYFSPKGAQKMLPECKEVDHICSVVVACSLSDF